MLRGTSNNCHGCRNRALPCSYDVCSFVETRFIASLCISHIITKSKDAPSERIWLLTQPICHPERNEVESRDPLNNGEEIPPFRFASVGMTNYDVKNRTSVIGYPQAYCKLATLSLEVI